MTEKITRKEQALNTRNRLLETALALFKEKGYENVTIEQICKAANVTTGAFYHHLKSKAGVVIEGYAEYDEFIEEVSKDVKSKNYTSYIDAILAGINWQNKFIDSLGLEAITEVYKIQITEGRDYFISQDRSIFKNLNRLVKEAQIAGEIIDDFPSEVLSEEILIVSRGVIYNWCQNKGSNDIHANLNRIVGNYVKSLKKI